MLYPALAAGRPYPLDDLVEVDLTLRAVVAGRVWGGYR